MRAAEFVRDGMVVGLGTGRTAAFAVRHLGEMAGEGMSFIAVSTSEATSKLAASVGIEVSTLDEHPAVDLTIDGADEVDPGLELIKGKGGALLREKIIAASTSMEIIVVDEAKLVDCLGEKEALPVEVLRFGLRSTMSRLTVLGCTASLRSSGGAPFVTDNGNYIVDCAFGPIRDPAGLHSLVNCTPGVVDNGLFLGMAKKVVVGGPEGVRIMERK